MIDRVVLIGLSGVGKSTTARMIAAELGWMVVDLDANIEIETGRTIPELFESDGEARFREIEASIFRRALSESRVVIATGGGAVIDPSIWEDRWLGDPTTFTVWLDGSTDVLVRRLREQAAREGGRANRPLLAGDPISTIEGMRQRRSVAYSRARLTLDVSDRDPAAVAADVAELIRLANGESTSLQLQVETASSRIQVGPDVTGNLAATIAQGWPHAQRVFVAADAGVLPHVTDLVQALAHDLQRPVLVRGVPSGEASKSVAGLSDLWDWFLGEGMQRGDVVVALGGGVVGDLAGFAAASVLRGVGLVQVPTTLLSMVDSSVGGKTAINHATGKNLIGAFYQASDVLIDPALLATLPPRECRSGWGEIIKHAVIEPSTPGGNPPVLLSVLERNQAALTLLQEPLLSWVIRRNVSIKAAVVAADEREAGIRAYLNFGHTIGHGIEAAGYSLLHGEAVAVGMSAALEIALRMDLIDCAFAERIRALIDAYGLPLKASVDPEVVRQKMVADKKKSSGRQTWVLPRRAGGVELRVDVPDEVISQAIQTVTNPD